MLRKILIGLFVLILLLALGAVYIVAQGQVYFPQTGNYPIGRIVLALLDESREEVFTEDPDDKRELQITLYYPIADSSTPLASYAETYMLPAISAYSGIPETVYSWIHSNSHIAPAAEGSFPLIIFSPGMGNLPQFYSSLLEGLASEGYVVAALAHPYSTGVVAFADGRVLQANELGSDALVKADDEAVMMAAEAAISAVWAADMRFVLEKLPELNAMLSGAIDTERIGLLGHSFGGIALHQALAAEPRFLAGINLDGRGLATPPTFSQPYLFMMSDVPVLSAEQMELLNTNQQELEASYQNTLTATLPLVEASTAGYALTLLNSAHNTFTTDWTLLPPLYSFAITDALVGSIDGAVAYETIRQTCLQFFEATLNGESYTPEQNPALRVNYP